jgi:hypothetical protein
MFIFEDSLEHNKGTCSFEQLMATIYCMAAVPLLCQKAEQHKQILL